MRIVITGAEGFLGWHTRVRLHATTDHEVVPVGRLQWARLPELVRNADAVIHIAGVNRASDREVEDGNVQLARDVAGAVRRSASLRALVYANSTQSDHDSPYGRGKAAAAEVLAEAAGIAEASFINIVLPNIFGEHGRPDYNSFVATFAHRVASGETPSVQDRDVELLHAQEAAQAIIDGLHVDNCAARIRPEGTRTTVETVLRVLEDQFRLYRTGDIPELRSHLQVMLFNTLRAVMFPVHYPITLTRRSDARGSLIETVRAHGGQGQTFFSTTKPGITRGQHFHLRKVERFVVVSGQAQISLRRALTADRITFDVSGDRPSVIDMPTLWSHKITNTGSNELTTMFWTNELFDPEDTDTYGESV